MRSICTGILVVQLCCACLVAHATPPNRVTILYDAFTARNGLASDWGYAALVEFEGKCILFDTGNNADLFEANVKSVRVDLAKLDLVVLSHRHGDHTSGLAHVLSMNPTVPVYAPFDETFRDTTPPAFLTQSADPSLACQDAVLQWQCARKAALSRDRLALHSHPRGGTES